MSDFKLSSKILSQEPVEKLTDRLLSCKKELFNLRFQVVTGELTNSSRFLSVRRNIARIKTELTKRSTINKVK